MARPLVPQRILTLTADPSGTYAVGAVYYNSAANELRVYTGSAWVTTKAAVATTVDGYATNSPAVAAGATWTITHNLGSLDVLVGLRSLTSPTIDVSADITYVDTNTITVTPTVAVASGELRAMVKKVI